MENEKIKKFLLNLVLTFIDNNKIKHYKNNDKTRNKIYVDCEADILQNKTSDFYDNLIKW